MASTTPPRSTSRSDAGDAPLERLAELASRLARDLDDLLTEVLGNAELSRRQLTKPSQVAYHLQEVITAASQARELTRELAGFAGQEAPRLEALALPDLVAAAVIRFHAELPADVALEIVCPPDLPAVRADDERLRQIVDVLLANAASALRGGAGRITVRAGKASELRAALYHVVLAPPTGDDEYLFLEVSDDGSGMTEEVQDRIFDPFFTTRQGARGVGLATLLGALRSLGGGVQFRSAPGAGSTFRVLLPAAAGAIARPGPVVGPGGARTILVIDDEEAVRHLARAALEREGYPVIDADCGRAGLDQILLNAGRIGCVLLDVTMPGMDGLEVLRRIRAEWPDLPVVLSSGYFHGGVHEDMAALGATAFLRKPYGPREMVACVRSAVTSPSAP